MVLNLSASKDNQTRNKKGHNGQPLGDTNLFVDNNNLSRSVIVSVESFRSSHVGWVEQGETQR